MKNESDEVYYKIFLLNKKLLRKFSSSECTSEVELKNEIVKWNEGEFVGDVILKNINNDISSLSKDLKKSKTNFKI